MSEWRVNINDGESILTETEGLYDVIVSDTFNPFGNFAKAFVDDLNARIFDAVRRGTKVAFEYDNQNTTGFTQRFVGFVVNDLAKEADGAEQLEIEAYSFDQFLRGNEVSNDQSGKRISTALEDVIKTDVEPVSWDATQVSVVDDQELTQSYQGESVEEFLLSVRQKSAGETFAVNSSLTFTFGVAEANRTRRDIDNSQWVTHDIGEESGETRNQVTVYYGANGEQAVTIDNAEDQLRVGENLNTNGPAQQAASITRTDIKTVNDAIAAGKSYLEGREATLTGTVTTFELNDAVPGETIGVTIEPRGIDTDFRIAENRIQWRGETNQLTVVQKKGADDDILIEQSKTLQQLERSDRNPDVLPDKTTSTDIECWVRVTGDADGVGFETTRITNAARDTLVSTWTSSVQPSFDVQEFVVSESDRRPSRSDTSFPTEITRTGFSVATPTATTVEFSASVSATNVRSVGLVGPSDLFFVGLLEQAVDNPTITMTIDVQIKPDEPTAKLLTNGQTFVRDVIDPNTVVDQPLPDTFEFGSDTTTVSESDTSLTTVATRDITNEIVNATSGSQFSDLVSLDDTQPVFVSSSGIELAQTAAVEEAENIASGSTVSNVDLSAGEGIELTSLGSRATIASHEVNYTIPAGEWGIVARGIRLEDTGDFPQRFAAVFDGFSGTTIGGLVFDATTPTWDIATGGFDIEPGTYDISVELVSGGDAAALDLIGLVDKRYVPDIGNFDNTVHQDDGYLTDPKLYPETQTVEFANLEFPFSVQNAEVDQTWNDVSEDQSLTVEGQTGTNTSTVSALTLGDSSRNLSISATLSNYPTDLAQFGTPRYDYNGQIIQDQTVTVDIAAASQTGIGEVTVRTRIGGATANGESFAEAGQLVNGTLLTRTRIPAFTKQSPQAVIGDETLRWVNHPDN